MLRQYGLEEGQDCRSRIKQGKHREMASLQQNVKVKKGWAKIEDHAFIKAAFSPLSILIKFYFSEAQGLKER